MKLTPRQRRRIHARFMGNDGGAPGEGAYAIATSFLPERPTSVAEIEDAIRWAWAHPARKRRRKVKR